MNLSRTNSAKLIGAAADMFISEINESILTLNPHSKKKDAQKDDEEEKQDEKPTKLTAKQAKAGKDKNIITKVFTVNHLQGAL